MRIAISLLNFRPGQIGGTETYLRELLPRLPLVSPNDEFFVVAGRNLATEVSWPGFRVATVDRGAAEIVSDRILEAFTPYRARYAERAFAEIAPDVSFFPQQSLFPKRIAGPTVLTVVDVQHLSLPRNFSWKDRCFRAAIYPYSLHRADRVLAISGFVRETLIDLCRVRREKIGVTLLGWKPHRPAEILTSCPVRQPFLFFPAASLPHKNHFVLLRTIAVLRSRGQFPYRLVLSGIQTSYWRDIDKRIAQFGLRDIVEHVGYVAPSVVDALYRHADAVLFPTTYEGFGLPIVEAVSFGKKVIASRLPVFEELGVPDAFMIDFSDPEQLRGSLALPGPTVLKRSPITWEQCAETTMRELRCVASRSD